MAQKKVQCTEWLDAPRGARETSPETLTHKTRLGGCGALCACAQSAAPTAASKLSANPGMISFCRVEKYITIAVNFIFMHPKRR